MDSVVDVVIPAHNAERYIEQAAMSASSEDIVARVIIIDDGSDDDTLPIAAELSRRNSKISVLTQHNKGVSAARNIGLANVREPYVCFLDADDRLVPGALASLVSYLQSYPGTVGVFGWVRYIGSDSEDLAIKVNPDSGEERCLSVREVLQGNFTDTPGSLLLRANDVVEVGGFDEALNYGEDWELYSRLAFLGRFSRVPIYVAEYRLHAQSAMSRYDSEKHERAMETVFQNKAVLKRFNDIEIDMFKLRVKVKSLRVAAQKNKGLRTQIRNVFMLLAVARVCKGDPMVVRTTFLGIGAALKRLI